MKLVWIGLSLFVVITGLSLGQRFFVMKSGVRGKVVEIGSCFSPYQDSMSNQCHIKVLIGDKEVERKMESNFMNSIFIGIDVICDDFVCFKE
jgi:hypothetical protein